MKKIYIFITTVALAMAYNHAGAEPVDSGPPAQQQKDSVPPSTTHGDFLEPQPDENGANADTQNQNKKAMKKHNKNTKKPDAAVKGKNQTEQPSTGGVTVE